MAWWRRGPGWRQIPYSMGGSTYEFDRAQLDATALIEIGQKMKELSGPYARLDCTGWHMAPLDLAHIEGWSPADLDQVTLRTTPDPAAYSSAGLPDGSSTFLGIHLSLNYPGTPPPAALYGLNVGVMGSTTSEGLAAGEKVANLVVKLARPVPNGASLLWSLPALAAAALLAPLVVAAAIGELHPLLWPAALAVTALTTGLVTRWVRRVYGRRRVARSILMLDRRPRRVIEEQRENQRQNTKATLQGVAYGIVASIITAGLIVLLRLQ